MKYFTITSPPVPYPLVADIANQSAAQGWFFEAALMAGAAEIRQSALTVPRQPPAMIPAYVVLLSTEQVNGSPEPQLPNIILEPKK